MIGNLGKVSSLGNDTSGLYSVEPTSVLTKKVRRLSYRPISLTLFSFLSRPFSDITNVSDCPKYSASEAEKVKMRQ